MRKFLCFCFPVLLFACVPDKGKEEGQTSQTGIPESGKEQKAAGEIKKAQQVEDSLKYKRDSIASEKVNQDTLDNLFPGNNIGVVYLDSLKKDSIHLKVRFPFYNLKNQKRYINNDSILNFKEINTCSYNVVFFDEQGRIFSIDSVQHFQYRLWCHNDGGMCFEPTISFKSSKEVFSQTPHIQSYTLLSGIMCFAIINPVLSELNEMNESGEPGKFDTILFNGRISLKDQKTLDSSSMSDSASDKKIIARIIQSNDGHDFTDPIIKIKACNHQQSYTLNCPPP